MWLRLSRGDVVAALICLALVAGFTWFRWADLPGRDRATVTTEATVVAIAYGFPRGHSGAQAWASIRLRLDDGKEADVTRTMRCLLTLNRGDRVRLVGSRDNAGRRVWSIVGEPCPA